jgi:amino acid transporter
MKKTLFDIINIAIGGMIGGGIFYLNGVAVFNVKDYSPFIWLIGIIICLTVAYSYIILDLEYPSDEGTTFYTKKLISNKSLNDIIGIIIILGYISLVCVYSLSLGYYLSEFLNIPSYNRIFAIFGILFTLIINYLPKSFFAEITDWFVPIKVIIFCFIIIYGLLLKTNQATPSPKLFSKGVSSYIPIITILSFGLSSFLSFEGFEMISNSSKKLTNRKKNIPYAYLISILTVGIIYMGITFVTYKHIGGEINKHNQYSSLLHLVKKYGLKNTGSLIIVILSIIANITAINSTLFTKREILGNIIPHSSLNKTIKQMSSTPISIPFITDFLGEKREFYLWITVLCSIILVFVPERITTNLGSMLFLLIFMIISVSGYSMVLNKQKEKKEIVILGMKMKPIVSKSIISISIISCFMGFIYLILHTLFS